MNGAGSEAGRGDDDGVVERTVLGEGRDGLGDRRALLADGDVDALHAGSALVDDRVGGDGRLAGLAVADDELALAAPDRRHGVDDLYAGLERLGHRLARDDARRLDLEAALGGVAERALAVDRLAERVHDSAQEGVAHRHRQDPARRTHDLAFVQAVHVAEHDGSDGLLVEVEGQPDDPVLELEQLVDRRPGQAGDPGDAVADLGDPADLLDLDPGGELGDVSRQRGCDVFGVDHELRHRWGSFVLVLFFGHGHCLGPNGCAAADEQRLAELVEAVADRAVDDGVADLDRHPADEGGRHLDTQLDGSADRPLERLGETASLLVVEVDGRAHLSDAPAPLLGGETCGPLEGPDDVTDVAGFEKITDEPLGGAEHPAL